MSKTIEMAFFSGKILKAETECDSIAEFFETNDLDGSLPDWLVFQNGLAVQVSNLDWIKMEDK